MMMSAICSVNGISSQKPRPHASSSATGDACPRREAAAKTSSVASSAKTNASGTQRSVHAVNRRARRAIQARGRKRERRNAGEIGWALPAGTCASYPAGMRSRVLHALRVGCCVASPAGGARADEAVFDDPYDVPRAPRPPTLPELTHSELTATLETTAGAILPEPGPGAYRRTAYVQRLGVEVPRRAAALVRGARLRGGGGRRAASVPASSAGNVQLQGRTALGDADGARVRRGIRPRAAHGDRELDRPGAGRRGRAARGHAPPVGRELLRGRLVRLRPFVDVRALDGPFVVQFRQGLDVMVSTASDRQAGPLRDGRRLLRLARDAACWPSGLEAFEAYAIDVPGRRRRRPRDGRRVAQRPPRRCRGCSRRSARSRPSARPLQGASQQIWGFRLALTLVYDPTSTWGMQGQEIDGRDPAGRSIS